MQGVSSSMVREFGTFSREQHGYRDEPRLASPLLQLLFAENRRV